MRRPLEIPIPTAEELEALETCIEPRETCGCAPVLK